MFCRLGVRSAALHDIYSPAVTQALKSALLQFDRKLPGFITEAGLLHGVETRTSSPVSGLICNTLKDFQPIAGYLPGMS